MKVRRGDLFELWEDRSSTPHSSSPCLQGKDVHMPSIRGLPLQYTFFRVLHRDALARLDRLRPNSDQRREGVENDAGMDIMNPYHESNSSDLYRTLKQVLCPAELRVKSHRGKVRISKVSSTRFQSSVDSWLGAKTATGGPSQEFWRWNLKFKEQTPKATTLAASQDGLIWNVAR